MNRGPYYVSDNSYWVYLSIYDTVDVCIQLFQITVKQNTYVSKHVDVLAQYYNKEV